MFCGILVACLLETLVHRSRLYAPPLPYTAPMPNYHTPSFKPTRVVCIQSATCAPCELMRNQQPCSDVPHQPALCDSMRNQQPCSDLSYQPTPHDSMRN